MRFYRLCERAAIGSSALFVGLWLGASGAGKGYDELRVIVGSFALLVCLGACAGYVSGINEEAQR